MAWTRAHIGGEVSLEGLITIGLKELAERMQGFDPRLPRPYIAAKLLRLASPLFKRPNGHAIATAAATPAEPRDRTQRMADNRPAGQGYARGANGDHTDNRDGAYAHNQYESFPAAAPQRRRGGWRTPRRPHNISVR